MIATTIEEQIRNASLRVTPQRVLVLEAVKMDELVLPEDVIVVPESFF